LKVIHSLPTHVVEVVPRLPIIFLQKVVIVQFSGTESLRVHYERFGRLVGDFRMSHSVRLLMKVLSAQFVLSRYSDLFDVTGKDTDLLVLCHFIL
jgi:hypothetical protein